MRTGEAVDGSNPTHLVAAILEPLQLDHLRGELRLCGAHTLLRVALDPRHRLLDLNFEAALQFGLLSLHALERVRSQLRELGAQEGLGGAGERALGFVEGVLDAPKRGQRHFRRQHLPLALRNRLAQKVVKRRDEPRVGLL